MAILGSFWQFVLSVSGYLDMGTTPVYVDKFPD